MLRKPWYILCSDLLSTSSMKIYLHIDVYFLFYL